MCVSADQTYPGAVPLEALREARRAVPVLDYCVVAFAVTGVAALTVAVGGHIGRASLILAVGLLGKALIAGAVWLLQSPSPHAREAGRGIIWAATTAFVGFALLTVVALGTDWPGPLADFLGLSGRPPFG